jgi:hypothetical protein
MFPSGKNRSPLLRNISSYYDSLFHCCKPITIAMNWRLHSNNSLKVEYAKRCPSRRCLLSWLPNNYNQMLETEVRHKKSHVDLGPETSILALWVIGGDKRGSLKSETVKYDHKSYETQTQKWLHWQGPAAIVNDRPVLSSERAPHITKPATVWE